MADDHERALETDPEPEAVSEDAENRPVREKEISHGSKKPDKTKPAFSDWAMI